jgi:hypothetical protein
MPDTHQDAVSVSPTIDADLDGFSVGMGHTLPAMNRGTRQSLVSKHYGRCRPLAIAVLLPAWGAFFFGSLCGERDKAKRLAEQKTCLREPSIHCGLSWMNLIVPGSLCIAPGD